LSLLTSAFALPIPPADLSIHLRSLTERSSTAHTEVCTPSSGLLLSPVKSSAQTDSTSELLRFLSRVAASKPTSWLSMPFHIVSHLAVIGDLSCGSGLFPFPRRTLAPAVCLPHSLSWYSEFAMVW